MNRFDFRAVILASSVLVLSSCSFVAGLFPDKQKQYKFSSEIPALEIPPDLHASTIEGSDNRVEPSRLSASADKSTLSDESENGSSQATLAQNSDDIPLIELEASYAEAWNEVGKALGRLRLEVSDQNRSDGLYYVYFREEDKPYEDRGLFGDLSALFTGSEPPAKEYRVKLEDRRNVTVIYVLDENGEPRREGPGLDLLKRLHQTLSSLDEFQEPDKE